MVPAPEKRVVGLSRRESVSSSSMPRKKPLGALLLLGVALFAGNGNAVQTSPAGAPQAAGVQDDEAVHKQMEELIKTVELNLRKIDTALYAAAASGRGPKEPVADAGISRLLTQAQDDGRATQRDMARILELAASHKHRAKDGGGT